MLAAPPRAAKTRKESLDGAEKFDMAVVQERVRHLSVSSTPINTSTVPPQFATHPRTSSLSHPSGPAHLQLSPAVSAVVAGSSLAEFSIGVSAMSTAAAGKPSTFPFSPTNVSFPSTPPVDAFPMSPIHQTSVTHAVINPPLPTGPPPSSPLGCSGKMFYYIGSKPIRSEDWMPAYVTLQGHELQGMTTIFPGVSAGPTQNKITFVEYSNSVNVKTPVFSWPICVGCKVGKAEDISKKGDRTKWGFVFCIECTQSSADNIKKEIYFVAETDEIGATWVEKIYDARHMTHWLAPWEMPQSDSVGMVEQCLLLKD